MAYVRVDYLGGGGGKPKEEYQKDDKPKPSKPKTSGTTRVNSGGSQTPVAQGDYQYTAYPDMSNIYQARLDSIKNSLASQRDNAIKGYQSQIEPTKQQYQELKNQSEVERYKAQNKLRNALADRGALDSGAGRTEQLAMQTNYGNALGKINRQEASALDEINRAIADVNNQYNQKVAEAEANMYGDISDWLMNITPMSINLNPYLQTAQNSIVDGSLANVGSNMSGGALDTNVTQVPGLAFLLNGNTGMDTSGLQNSQAYRLLKNALGNRLLSTVYNN